MADNPSAFPKSSVFIEPRGEIRHFQDGMSLRDWFAGQALAGMLAGLPADKWADRTSGVVGFKAVSAASYSAADAMLAERTKTDDR